MLVPDPRYEHLSEILMWRDEANHHVAWASCAKIYARSADLIARYEVSPQLRRLPKAC